MALEQLDQASAREILSFQISYNKQKMKATWALALLIVAIFLLEEYFGGSQNMAVLVRMGANVGARVKNGEYYRLFSSVFLHAGLMHVFFNTYVLFALGGFFNRIMGETKYLTVFFFSGIVGSLASVYLGKATISVGASGAIWGLFGASLALAFFKTSLLPETIRLRLRRVTFINLIINLGISFLPMIDFWAHIGGGIGGFLISLLIIFRPKNQVFFNLSERFFQFAAFILAAMYLASIGYGMWLFKPWANQIGASLVEKNLESIPFSMGVPKGLREEASPKNNSTSAYYVFGDPELDQMVVEVHFFHQKILGSSADKAWLSAQREELLHESSVPAKVKKTIYFRETPEGGVLYYEQTAKNSDLVIHNYVITRREYAIKLSILAPEKTNRVQLDQLGNKIIDSIHAR